MPDPHTIALGVRQPWIELILRGEKTIEVRSAETRVRGTIYLYASKKRSTLPAARRAAALHELNLDELPCGLLVGSVELVSVRPTRADDRKAACVPAELLNGNFAWELRRPCRFEAPLPVEHLPCGVWFYPFRRKHESAPCRRGG